MATEEKQPKRSGWGWIPKLSLWAVVIAFGYLYITSIDRDRSGEEMPVAAADEASPAAVDPDAGGLEKIMGKLSELAASAETFIADTTAAGASTVKDAVEKVKGLTGMADESPAAAAPPVESPAVAASAPEPAPTAAQPAAQVVAEGQTPPSAVAERPPASGFDRHYAPLPAVRGTAQTHEETAAAAPTAEVVLETPPVKDAEATAFAESVMQPPATETAPPAPTAESVRGPGAAVPAQPMAQGTPMPVPGSAPMPSPGTQPDRETPAEYRARMMAEYEKMRRLADQRAREYWDRMQAQAPVAVPPYPAYGPAHGPYYGPPAYPR